MNVKYIGLSEINGPLVALDHVSGISYDEMAEIKLDDGTRRLARVVEVEKDRAVLQVFEGTKGLSLVNTTTSFQGKPMELALSTEMLGRIFSGAGKPIDGLGEIFPEKYRDINGSPLNPVSRTYPRNYINTGISSIDALTTLIRGQKLPIFSGSGLSHNKLAVQIVRQAKIADENGQDFAIVFGAMGVKNDVADYFKRCFEETGVLQRVAMFLNLSNDPIIERILTPRCALTCAEYLAFEHDMQIPGRKGYPGYLYSDLASIYERAGIVKGAKGSVTQIPILTMPNDDITHPVPDLTGYITEGQIVLDRNLDQTGVYPAVSILPSLSRLMKDGIGEGYTREDHPMVSNQLFAAYAKVQDARSLASVIGEEELSDTDKAYLKFGTLFEKHFIDQGFDVNRTIDETLDLGWSLLSTLPKSELDRVDEEHLEHYYSAEKAKALFAED